MTEHPHDVDLLEPEIRERIRTELLVRRLLADAEPQDERKPASTRHPAFLLVLSFALTGIVGSLLTSCWQAQDWGRQESFRVADDATKQRIEVMNLATKSIAESFTAAEDVLHVFFWSWPTDSTIVTFEDRSKAWQVASHDWRIDEKVLIANVNATYSRSRPPLILSMISANRLELGNMITRLIQIEEGQRRSGKYAPGEEEEIETLKRDAQSLIYSTTGPQGHLGRLVSAMIDETHAREQRIDTSVWTSLARSLGPSG